MFELPKIQYTTEPNVAIIRTPDQHTIVEGRNALTEYAIKEALYVIDELKKFEYAELEYLPIRYVSAKLRKVWDDDPNAALSFHVHVLHSKESKTDALKIASDINHLLNNAPRGIASTCDLDMFEVNPTSDSFSPLDPCYYKEQR